MAYGAHREDDSRTCGATTVVTGQSTVYVNGKLWAVKDDPNTHGSGQLINTTGSTVIINNKKIIVNGPDNAQPDSLCPEPGGEHCNPKTSQGSGDVFAY